jgi:hypothetical protein
MREKLLTALRRLYPFEDLDSGLKNPLLANPVWVHGTEREALLYALLYVPEFVEVEGSILQIAFPINPDTFPQSFIDAKKEKKWPLNQLEDSFNRVDTSYACRNVPRANNITAEDDELFAECIAEAWRGRLALLYPKRRFKVSMFAEDGSGYSVTFHEVR